MHAAGTRLSVGGFLSALMELTKARITVFVMASLATGHILFMERLTWDLLLPMLGIFLLACGSAAMNQVQEARFDARMKRTCNRPIPSGRIPRDWAAFIALLLICAGLYVLTSIEHHALVLLALGALSVIWYNGVYLLLKRVTAFAVVPGSLVGAIPPVIGWCAAGGWVFDATILEIAAFFFLWQIPHFWLLLLLFGKEYEEAGLPSATSGFTTAQFGRITLSWVILVAASGLVVSVTQRFALPWNLVALVACLWLVFTTIGRSRRWPERGAVVSSFLRINVFALAMMVLLSLNALT